MRLAPKGPEKQMARLAKTKNVPKGGTQPFEKSCDFRRAVIPVQTAKKSLVSKAGRLTYMRFVIDAGDFEWRVNHMQSK